MYYENRLCVPTDFTWAYIRGQHSFHGHVGADRLWYHFEPMVEFADTEMAKKFTNVVGEQCETCQATRRARKLAGPWEPTPVPPRLMYSVCLDLFYLPPVEHEGEVFDTLAVCVDRHSGWIIGVPCLNKGLTGAKLAQKC